MPSNEVSETTENANNGGRNLTLLGIVAIIIACVTTGLSLYIYHESGDIYIDRSRPGFLPDEDENTKETTKYVFSDDGKVDKKTMEEYLKEFKRKIDSVNVLNEPFSADPLSDESLGLSVPKETENTNI